MSLNSKERGNFNGLVFLLSVVGMCLTLHLWIQKERRFDGGCWGGGDAAPAGGDCGALELSGGAELFGVSNVQLGYFFYLVVALLAFAQTATSSSWAARWYSVGEFLVGLGFSYSLYLVYIQISVGKFCPLCLLNSGIVTLLFAANCYLWSRGGFVPLSETTQLRERARMNGIMFVGAGAALAILVFLNRVGVRRLDQGVESEQVEAVIARVAARDAVSGRGGKADESSRKAVAADRRLETSEWVGPGTPFLGNKAGLPVILFLDPNCVHCKDTFKMFVAVAKKYERSCCFYLLGRPLWEYSILQVQALEVGAEQGKYFELWGAQFDRQRKGGLDLAALKEIHERLGLGTDDLSDQLDRSLTTVVARRGRAQSAGINSTPTMYVDGVQVRGGVSEKAVCDLIDAAIAKHPVRGDASSK